MTPTLRRGARLSLPTLGALLVPLLFVGVLGRAAGTAEGGVAARAHPASSSSAPMPPFPPMQTGQTGQAGQRSAEQALPEGARELLERCKLEQELVLAEPTAVMLGELLRTEASGPEGAQGR